MEIIAPATLFTRIFAIHLLPSLDTIYPTPHCNVSDRQIDAIDGQMVLVRPC